MQRHHFALSAGMRAIDYALRLSVWRTLATLKKVGFVGSDSKIVFEVFLKKGRELLVVGRVRVDLVLV